MSTLDIKTPTPSELDCLAVLWRAQAEEGRQALRLSEIRERVGRRRSVHGEPMPALTTISSQLRSATAKGLLIEVIVDEAGHAGEAPPRSRGMLSPATRSPQTGYKPAYPPEQVLNETLKALASVFPVELRKDALLRFAEALDLPKKKIKEIEKLLDLD